MTPTVKHPANGEYFATLHPEKRPRALNLAALRRMRIGPVWPGDENHQVGMRGTVPPKGTDPDWPAHRRWRQVRRRMARASRRAQR